MDDTAAHAWRTTIRRRLGLATILFGAWAVGIEARLVWLQVYQYDERMAQALLQQRRTVDVAARRGDITDRLGRTMALSVSAETVFAIPKVITSPKTTIDALCSALDDCGPQDRDALVTRLRQKQNKQFLYLKRRVTPDEARRVAALDLQGISLLTESRRYYPNRELAAHVLGYVGLDNKGLGGIESAYDSKIRGIEGTLLVDTDARLRAFGRIGKPPTAGATVELTIDAHLQHIAERELRVAVEQRRALGGTIVITDPRSGEILALANEPTFNPNSYTDATPEQRRNRAVQIYEPGSTFKIVTASAAIEEGVFTADEPIDVSEGAIRIGSRRVEDVHRYGVLSFTDVLVKSSNVGAIRIGARLGAERLGRYVRRFGFGTRLCPDLPGESAGMLSDSANWTLSTLASISMGYEIGVTPIQMAAAVSSVANGGSLIQPRAVRALRRGSQRTAVEPLELRHSIDGATIAELTTIMEQVVERGTATKAQVPGFTVAGKTGTAAKIVNGRYSSTDYYSSFVGFVPSRRPALTIVVVIDRAQGGEYYGGVVAAPVFKRVAEQALRYLGVAPTVFPPTPFLVAQDPGAAPAGRMMPVATRAGDHTVEVATAPPVVPDLHGLSGRDAILRLARLGLVARVSGDGVVIEQHPAAGAPVDQGGTCTLRLERVSQGPAPPSAPQ